jgi:eukaryotic-like serine/threonine-protein kinase
MRVSLNARLRAILDAADDPFTRDWWSAVERSDVPTLKSLLQRPELRRMSSRELASLADGLSGRPTELFQLLNMAYERYPGEFLVHFRLAMLSDRGTKTMKGRTAMLRHITAAIAVRPRSAIARCVLGMELLDLKRESAGRRMLQSASEVDPTSPRPHLFVGLRAAHSQNWDELIDAYKAAARADPDTAHLMMPASMGSAPEAVRARLVKEVAAIQPNHPGSHELLGGQYLHQGNYRAALAAYRLANEAAGKDHAGKVGVLFQIGDLERKARWEGMIDAVLAGTIKPSGGNSRAIPHCSRRNMHSPSASLTKH